jgi:hypothetical protein
MTLFEILDEMGNLCDTHDIQFEVNSFGVIIRKYFDYGDNPCNFNQAFSFEIFKHRDLEDCVLEFERRLEKNWYMVKGER